MLVTLLGMVTLVRAEQFWKAILPMLVTERSEPETLIVSGMVTVPLKLLVKPLIVTWLLLAE